MALDINEHDAALIETALIYACGKAPKDSDAAVQMRIALAIFQLAMTIEDTHVMIQYREWAKEHGLPAGDIVEIAEARRVLRDGN